MSHFIPSIKNSVIRTSICLHSRSRVKARFEKRLKAGKTRFETTVRVRVRVGVDVGVKVRFEVRVRVGVSRRNGSRCKVVDVMGVDGT